MLLTAARVLQKCLCIQDPMLSRNPRLAFLCLKYIFFTYFHLQLARNYFIAQIEIKIANKKAATKRITLLHAQNQFYIVAVKF